MSTSMPTKTDLTGNPTAGAYKTALGQLYDFIAQYLPTDGSKPSADDITNTPAGNISATDVQAAINGLDAEKIQIPANIAQGDIIYRGASGFERLPAGINGQNLKTKGPGANPEWVDDMALPGIPDYIASGRKITPNATALRLDIAAGVNYISGQPLVRVANTLDIPARTTALVYDKSDGTSGHVPAVFPEVDTNTVARWIIDGSATIANSAVGVNGNTIAVANNLTKTGTVAQVDGWIGYGGQGDGSTGYYTSANSTGFPTGVNEREIDCLITANNDSVRRFLFSYGTVAQTFGLEINASNNFQIVYASTSIDTGFAVENGKTYLVSLTYDGVIVKLYVNGVFVYSLTVALATAASNLYVLDYMSGGYKSKSTIHYVEIRNALHTPAQIAQISNKLCLPCRYYADASKPDFTDIRENLPANSISLGFVRTNSTAVTEINDTDYKYGRREGATGGNRSVFLGWQYFSGATNLTWDNPFGTRKVKTYYTWSQDANGKNESDVTSRFYEGSAYGANSISTCDSRLKLNTMAYGVTYFNNTWQTSGYIGCYAEVIE